MAEGERQIVQGKEGLKPEVTIRPVTVDDLPEIQRILRATVQNPYGSGNVDEGEVQMEMERITKALAQPEGEDATLVARNQNGEILGFAFYGNPDPRLTAFTGSDPANTLELKLLYIDPDKRNNGIGNQMLESVENEARKRGKSKVELTSGPRYIMIGSGNFYRKKGYRLAGTIPHYFEGAYWAKVFQKEVMRQK